MKRNVAIASMGISMALTAAGLVGLNTDYQVPDRPRRKVHPLRDPSPNDFGPVIDTTPESKRARRRRLAKEGQNNG